MKIIASKTEEFFSSNTPLQQANEHGGREYEERPQQREMAIAVANSLTKKKHLIVEAPTGVGKSFAYLIPAIYHSIYTASRVVISTHTISLQEQLINKDIAILKKIIPQNFEAVIAKGRENYLCLRRLEQAWQQPENFLFEDEQLTELNRIKMWSIKTQDGSRSDLTPMADARTWRQVCCEQGNCQGQRCHHFERCFLMRMKMSLSNANV
ncbi:MAG: ATP-dependent DNA helicase, partial [Lentisphaeria bacterium]